MLQYLSTSSSERANHETRQFRISYLAMTFFILCVVLYALFSPSKFILHGIKLGHIKKYRFMPFVKIFKY